MQLYVTLKERGRGSFERQTYVEVKAVSHQKLEEARKLSRFEPLEEEALAAS